MDSVKRSIWSWAFYDWANSAFTTTVMAGFFPLFFKAYWADPSNPAQSTFYLGLANSVAAVLIGISAPFLGAVADRGSSRKNFLALFAALGILFTGGFWFIQQGHWLAAILVYVCAVIGWSGANVFYDALLTVVASQKKVDFVSALGYALGYIGGGILFLVNVLMFLRPSFFGLNSTTVSVKLAFVTVAVWWALFSAPLVFWVHEPPAQTAGITNQFREGWLQLRTTLKDIRRFRVVGMFLLAYWFYIDGVDTIVRMAVDYGKSLGFADTALITALLLVQFVAFPAALVYGWLATRIGAKRAVLLGIAGYGFITLFGYQMSQIWHFYTLAVLVGLFQGGIQAISRSLYTRIIPAGKSAEFFGFYNLLGKFAAVIGPVMMGSITLVTGNARTGILSILLLFFLGGFLLWHVDIEKGEKMVRECEND